MTRALFRNAVLCLALVAMMVPAAHASSGQGLTFEAPRDLLDASTRDATLDEIQSLGAKQLRVILYWHNVAPTPDSATKPAADLSDPASYAWGQYDELMAAAQKRGLQVLMTVSGPVPQWATESKTDTVTRPIPAEFKTFMTAVGKHYGGQVATWAIWNEPNHPQFLRPQYGPKGTGPVSGTIYRSLFLAGWEGLRAAGNGRDHILMGETAPVGTGKDVAPLTFLRQTLCLSDRYIKAKGCSNLPADGYAHHAYTTRLGPFYKPSGPNDVTIGVLPRLIRALDRAAAAGAIRHAMPIYLTEFGIQSVPDPVYGVSEQRQAEYYAISERLAWKTSRIASFSQYLMRDDLPGTGKDRYGGFESGLKANTGRKKLAFDAFRLPLVVTKTKHGVSIWGHVRPAPGVTDALLEVRSGSKRMFHKLKIVKTDARGYLETTSKNRSGGEWRLRWSTFSGAPTRAYPSAP